MTNPMMNPITHPQTRRRSAIAASGVLLLLFVVATACASDDPSPSVAPASDASLPEATASAPVQAAAPAPSPTPAPTPLPSYLDGTRIAPELSETGQWINSEPFTLTDQIELGQVVLVDFWTYTCINCIRTMPYLRDWQRKYADKGLVILGIHTPEFEFEKVYDNVVEAVEGFGLEYPVVQDNEFGTWNAFNNRAWPAKYLVDANRIIRYSHFGEGAYDETEAAIRALLVEAGYDLEGIPIGTDPGPEIAPAALEAAPGMGHTRELYAGWRRNYNTLVSGSAPPYVRHAEYYDDQEADISYTDPGDHQNHYIYLQGLWRNDEENLVHARATTDFEDYIAIKFYSTSVNGVMTPIGGASYRVRVTLDDQPVPADRAGIDIKYDDESQSYVVVDVARMYFLIDQAMFTGGELKLSSNSPELAFFAFTFGSYEGGEPGTDG